MIRETEVCFSCKKSTSDLLCNICLKDRQIVRLIIQQRIKVVMGNVTKETQSIITREFNRLDALWRIDHKLFIQEANKWHNEPPN